MARVINFSAGPSVLPEEVLRKAQDELLDWRDTGQSVMEMSHRGKAFVTIAETTESDLRELLAIPENYKVLFLQGGATGQFAMVPINLLGGKNTAVYVCTGSWSKKAIAEARRFCEVLVAATSEQESYTTIPPLSSWEIHPDAAYLHYTSNETIGGVEFQEIPQVESLPLVADMSSNILSREIDLSRFGLIYAGAQKNMGVAGITLVIVREDLIGSAPTNAPSLFDYRLQVANNSMLNTPPTFNWYILGLVLQWIKSKGGLKVLEEQNLRKADKLYRAIDTTSFYLNPVDPQYRSRMNVPFIIANEDLDDRFLSNAHEEGLINLKGHRSVGGMRASIYNAMPEEAIDTLIDFMGSFERKYG